MSTLNVNRIVDASGGVMAPISSVFKNRIINGAMVIDQRNAGASVNTTNASALTYTLDRWSYFASQTSKFTVQQNAGSVTPPAGFNNYLGVTSSSAYSIGQELFSISQNIEGFNVADLGWGTANAKTVTLSFWVRSSLTGTFGGSLTNAAQNRSYPFSYSIPSANTWTQISITIAGDTTGTWAASNTTGISVWFGLGVGSTISGTAGAWVGGGAKYSATGATSVVGTNGATFYITGVQLEVGTQATSFEYRQYQQELALCQRYYYVLASLGGTTKTLGTGFYANSSRVDCPVTFKTSMRASPTLVQVSGTSFYGIYANNAVDNFNSFTDASDTSTEGIDLYAGSNVSGTSGAAGQVFATTSGYIGFQAEL